jgi:hypothetical protein
MRIQEIFSQFVYVQPEDPEKIMIDFYFMVGYVYGTEFKDDVVDWVMKEAVKDCVEAHRKHMIKALKYCCAAELKHIDEYCSTLKKASSAGNLGAALNILKDHYSPLTYRFLVEYLSIKPLYFTSSGSNVDVDTDNPRLGLDKRNSKYPINPDSGKYLNQFKALVKTQRKIKYSDEDIAKVMIEMFDNSEGWNGAFGGTAWKRISECLLKLLQAKTLGDKIVYCDHAYDLEHNTGVVLNKLEHYAGNDNYRWIKKDLDWKRDNRSLKDFYDKVSTQLQKVVAYVSKYKYDEPLLSPERTSKKIEKIKKEVQGTTQEDWVHCSMDQIHVGDTVKLIDDSIDTLHKKGEEGKVVKVGGASLTHEHTIRIEYSDGSKFWEPYYNVNVKKGEQQATKNNTPIVPKGTKVPKVPVTASTATVGDKVIMNPEYIKLKPKNYSGYENKVATITQLSPNLVVDWDDMSTFCPEFFFSVSGKINKQPIFFFAPEVFTSEKATLATDLDNLKVGDEIRIKKNLSTIIQSVNEDMTVHKGKIATITELLPDLQDKPTYKINLDNGKWYWTKQMFEDPSKNNKTVNWVPITNLGMLETGLKVKIEKPSGTIEGTLKKSKVTPIAWVIDGLLYYKTEIADYIEEGKMWVEGEDTSTKPTRFKVGDKVVMIHDSPWGGALEGEEGVVLKVPSSTGQGFIDVTFPGHTFYEDPKNLKLISTPKSASTDEPDIAYTDFSNLQVGDKVKIKDTIPKYPKVGFEPQMSKHSGEVGTIIKKDPLASSGGKFFWYKVAFLNELEPDYVWSDDCFAAIISNNTVDEGDTVTVDPNLKQHDETGNTVTDSMLKYKGMKAKVIHKEYKTEYNRYWYYLDVDNEMYYWTKEMFKVVPTDTDTQIGKHLNFDNVNIGDKLHFTYDSGNTITGIVKSKDSSDVTVKWSDTDVLLYYTPKDFNDMITSGKLELDTDYQKLINDIPPEKDAKEDNEGWVKLTSVSQLSGGEKIKKENGATGEVVGTDSINSYTVEWDYNPGVATPYYQDDIDEKNWKYKPNTEDSDENIDERLVRKQIYTIDEFEVGKKVIFTNIQGTEYTGTITNNTGLTVNINYDNGGDMLYDAENLKSLLEKGRRKFELLVPKEEESSIEKKNGSPSKDEEPVHSDLEDFSDDGEIEQERDVEEGDYGGPVQWVPVSIKELVKGDLIRDSNWKQYEVLKIYLGGVILQGEHNEELYINIDHLFNMGPWEKVSGH